MLIDCGTSSGPAGLSNPMDAIEQLSYLIFLKRLDDRENATERQATRRGERYTPRVPAEMRWGHWTQFEAGKALALSARRDLPLVARAGRGGQLLRALHGQRRAQDQQARAADRGVQADRGDADRQPEPGCAGRPLRVPAGTPEHRGPQRPVPHPAPHRPHDGADDRAPARASGSATWQAAPAVSGSIPTNTSWSSTPRRKSCSTTPMAGPTTWWATC